MKSTANLTVSVIIPTYNHEDKIVDCVRSVLRQTYAAKEILVVDDGCTDGTSVILNDTFGNRIRLLRQENQGQSAATRRALDQATGDVVAFLDSDDTWEDGKLREQIDVLDAMPDVVAVYTDAWEFDVNDPGNRRKYHDLHPLLRDSNRLMEAMVSYDVPLRSTVVVRRKFLNDKHVVPDPEARGKDDIQMFMEILGHGGRFYLIDSPFVERAMHESNVSQNYFHRFNRRVIAYRNLLDRCQNFDPAWKEQVRCALSDAEFRIGEWHWGNGETKDARERFLNAIRLKRGDYRLYWWLVFTYIPAALIQFLRRVNQRRK